MMPSATETYSVPKPVRWTGYIMSALPVLLLFASSIMKFVKPGFVVEGFKHLGLPENLTLTIGILEFTCTVIYIVPRMAVLGAILLTGYLGGAILTHLRVGEPVFAQAIFGVLVWGGLYLRDPRLRALIPLRR